jgi:hypothetical protein
VELLSQVHFVRGVREEDGSTGMFSLAADIRAMVATLQAHPGIRLIVMDPITSYVFSKGSHRREIDSHNASQLREVLEPLVNQVAHVYGVTVIGVTHFMKDANRALIHRVMGSAAWSHVARGAIACVELPPEEEEAGAPQGGAAAREYALFPIKYSHGVPAPAITYTLGSAPVRLGDGHVASFVRTEWGRADPTITERALAQTVRQRAGGRPTAVQQAQQWLRGQLHDGPRATTEIEELGAAAGISVRALERARATMGVISERREGRWVLRLADDR